MAVAAFAKLGQVAAGRSSALPSLVAGGQQTFQAWSVPQGIHARTKMSEKELKERIASIGNIEKITHTMKVVSSQRSKASGDAAQAARNFSDGLGGLLYPGGESPPETDEEKAAERVKNENWVKRAAEAAETTGSASSKVMMNIPLTSDRGLCGAINSNIIRALDRELKGGVWPGINQFAIFGAKGESRLKHHAANYKLVYKNYRSLRQLSFRQCQKHADEIMALEFDAGRLYYTFWKSTMAFRVHWVPVPASTPESVDELLDNQFQGYTLLGGKPIMRDLQEYAMAVKLYHTLCESEASEQYSRMGAMTAASNSARDMIKEFQVMYNRTRQEKITNEMCEIIGGVVCFED